MKTYITLFDSVTKAYIYDQHFQLEMSWEDAAEFLQDHRKGEQKTDIPMFNMAIFKTIGDPTAELGRKYVYKNGEKTEKYIEIPHTVRRCKANVVAISGLVLDVDDSMRIDEVVEKLDGLEYVLYTTFRHTPEVHKFRVAIPFSQPLLAEDIAGRAEAIRQTFPGVDQSCFTQSQSFYFHSGHTDCIVWHAHGVIVDPYAFAEVPVAPKATTPKEYASEYVVTSEYKERVLTALRSCSGMRVSSGLTLVAICKTLGCSFEEYKALVQLVADPKSSVSSTAQMTDLWNTDYSRITNSKRDEFIRKHHGQPVQNIIGVGEQFSILTRRMKEKYGNLITG